jgi:hypothetical protein
MTEQLFGGKWAPFTERVWFIEAAYSTVVDAVRSWRSELPGSSTFTELDGSLDSQLEHLQPWAAPSWKELVVQTKAIGRRCLAKEATYTHSTS